MVTIYSPANTTEKEVNISNWPFDICQWKIYSNINNVSTSLHVQKITQNLKTRAAQFTGQKEKDKEAAISW